MNVMLLYDTSDTLLQAIYYSCTLNAINLYAMTSGNVSVRSR
jgi:hypothetical protein